MRRSKADDRGQLEIRRLNQITVDELKNKIDEKDEEIDYLKTRLEKLETENH
jgi:peptidoglycan hydrolase CwlO-like protein